MKSLLSRKLKPNFILCRAQNVRLASLADFNGDGWIDFVARGWNGDWHTAISSSTGSYDGYYITEDVPDAEDNTDPIRIKEALHGPRRPEQRRPARFVYTR